MNLTDEEIRIKVAEAMGLFRIKPLRRTTRKGNDDPNGVRLWYCSEHHGGAATYDEIPNYPEDLNACAEFEATLSMDFNKPDQWERYMDELHCLVYPTPEEEPEVYARKYVAKCRMISAKARQRCLAYLKTKGLIP